MATEKSEKKCDLLTFYANIMTQNYRNNLNKGFLICKRQEQGICRGFFSVVYLTLALNSPVKNFQSNSRQ